MMAVRFDAVPSSRPHTKGCRPFLLVATLMQGVTQPPVQPVVSPSTFGFVDNAERLNSRAAMVRHLMSRNLSVRCACRCEVLVRSLPCPNGARSPPHPPLQLGFFALLLLELVAGKGILDLIGLTTGNGLGFEF